MSNSQSSYRQIFRATSLFGGVQVFNILVSIIRSKMVAVLLGPAGMGMMGLYNSAVGLITGLVGLGLNSSAVRNIAAADQPDNKSFLPKVVQAVRLLMWITGLLGTLVTLILAPFLSKVTFGSTAHTTAFYWLSLSLLFTQLTNSHNVVLQGMRQYANLAKANVIGSLLSLVFSLPLYYFYKINGIIPAMISTSICTMLAAFFYGNKLRIPKVKIDRQTSIIEAKDMIKMGLLLSLSSFAVLGESYLIRIFISNTGSLKDVGLYNAGFAIIGTYVGMIFTAMGTDYYPRLAAVARENSSVRKLVNQQAEIAILILGPILCVFLIFVDWAIILLYSNQFSAVKGMVHWAALGMYFKAVGWAMGFIFLAKGNGKLFFWNEIITTSCLLGLNIAGYKIWQLNGLGISFFASYLIYFFQVYFLANRMCEFSFEPAFYNVFIKQILLGIGCFCLAKYAAGLWLYVGGGIAIFLSCYHSFTEINKRMNLIPALRKR